MSHAIELDLPENLTISNIHPVHEQFEAVVDDTSHDKILLNGEAVERVDTSGIQLLYALSAAAKERNMEVCWVRPSEKLCGAAEVLGMKSLIGIH